MQSVTTALTWEYFARNRWSLLLVPLLSSALALITLLPLRGVDLSGVPQRDVISIHLINVLCLVVAIVACVMGTQGSMSQLYLKPLSNAAIVNYFFWGGALLVACQAALILWMWKIFFVSDWPIIGSVLFAVVCWGVFQPIFRGSFNSLSWVILAPSAFFILSFWLMAKHGIPVQRGGMLSPQVHYWDSISGSDGLIALTTLCISYVLTVRRVNYDRSGRCRGAWTDRVRDFFASIDARSASRIRLFESPVQAQAWYDFQSRTASMVWPVLSILPWFWLLAVIAGAISQALSPGLTFAVMGAYFAALLPIIAAFFVPLAHHLKQTVILQFPSSEPDHGMNSLPLGMSPYLFSLPMSDRQRAKAILRSSAWACGIASATILLSFAVPVGLSWVFGADLFMGKKEEPVKLGVLVPWFLVVVCGGSMLLSFVFATLVCSLDVRKWSLRDGIAPIILVAVLLAVFTPIALPLSMLLGAIAAGYLVYATIEAVLREDISWVGASLVWLAGLACAAGLVFGMPSELGTLGWVLGGILLSLAMLPFFTTASALRDLRTT
jgi:hypothetical protein